MGRFIDLLGTTAQYIRIGLTGPRLKNNSGALHVRDAGDTAFADLVAATLQGVGLNLTGNDLVLNSDGASGADRKMTLRRPSTGMSADLVIQLPAGDPAPGQAMTVTSFAGGVITLDWATVAGGTDKVITDTTSLAFGAGATVNMFTLPANAVVKNVKIVIDTAFNGTPSVSIGVAGTTSKYMASTQVDLTAAAGTVFEVDPGLASNGSTEALIASYSAGSASAGAARILVDYVIPS